MQLIDHGVYYVDGQFHTGGEGLPTPAEAKKNTIAHRILSAHSNPESADRLSLTFDALISHDITYVGIIQTARASGMRAFPLPYAMTNCHNSLCAVGGTINEDDHRFGLSAAKKYGGMYVPANLAVIHTYAREKLAQAGGMILGSDSHTRYGALGAMGVGEGGPELVKQLLQNTYDVEMPKIIAVHVTGEIKRGVGPHDVALALVAATFKSGFVKNAVLEFIGPGIAALPVDFRCGVDVMTTETACLSSVWETDGEIENYYRVHGRPEAYRKLSPGRPAYYDAAIELDLSKIECMIALPFHPSNAYSIHTLTENAEDILSSVEREAERTFAGKVTLDLRKKFYDGRLHAEQGVIAGCAGGIFDNLCAAASILSGGRIGSFSLSVYPGSAPVELAILKNGVGAQLLSSGAVLKPAFCGPCFGAGDVPGNGCLSIRHATRNFPNREGSKPRDGQLSGVALMDARSIAATAACGGAITAATDIEYEEKRHAYTFDASTYERCVYDGIGKPLPETPLVFGPNIADWPAFSALSENLLFSLSAVIRDPVTTTDELIPSGETSSYRSNPEKLSEFALSRRCPDYVPSSKAARSLEKERLSGGAPEKLISALKKVSDHPEETLKITQTGSGIFAMRPGDGSAREQAASCQKVLGGVANICYEYATKRYRSNCINWGILPFSLEPDAEFALESGDYVFVPGIRRAIERGEGKVSAKGITKDGVVPLWLLLPPLTDAEKRILLSGCLINYYRANGRTV